jgi:hypothetical protein
MARLDRNQGDRGVAQAATRWLAPGLLGLAVCAVALAAGAEGDVAALWRQRMQEVRDLKAAIATAATALLALGLLLSRTGRADRFARGRDGLLLLLALATLFAWWHPYRGSLRAWLHVGDAFHYYVGAKYFDELGYQRLYHCAAVADAEAGMGRLLAISLVRDLETNQIRRTAELLSDPDRCKRHFTPARWREFTADVDFFRRKLPAPLWLKLRADHGYNPTPLWTLAGGLLVSTGPAGRAQFFALTSLDPLLLGGMFGALCWAFGWRVMCIALIYWGTNQPASWEWVGGSILRFDWLAASLVALCCLRRGYPGLAGGLLAWAAGVRVFPGVLAVALLAGALLRTRGRLDVAARRFALSFAAALALFVSLAALWSGPHSWIDFARNSRLHLATDSVNRMGLRPLLAYRHELRLERTLEPTAMDPSARWKRERARTFEARRPWAVAIGLAYLLLLALALRRQPDWAAGVLGIGAIPVLLELGNYYFAITTGFACLAARRPELGLGLVGLSAFTWWVGRWGGDDRDLVVALASAGTLLFVVFASARLALPPLGDEAGGSDAPAPAS